ncbi:MAG: pilus assembly protein HicB [Prevotellaceae bacterium]|nr:pilus assembly protein HicB [Prevotellaceae bacterium]
MKKKILVTIECAEDGTYACYSEEPIGTYALVCGDGKTVEEAKKDFINAVNECAELCHEDETYRNLCFNYKYDIRSFFNYFGFINVSEIAKIAGINPSLMRQYTSGIKKPGERTYKKMSECFDKIKQEFESASFRD